MQQELTEVAQALDPIGLLYQVEQLQQAIFRCAADCFPFLSSLPSAPLRIFSVENCTAGKLPEEGSFPNPAAGLESLYREQERRKRVLGWRRTHKDRFEGEWEQITPGLVANPERSSGDIFRGCNAAPLDAISPCKSAHSNEACGKYQPPSLKRGRSNGEWK